MADSTKTRELRKRRRRNPAGVWLTNVREGKGYDLDEWAAALDYNKSTVCRLETTGPVPVSVILAALAVPPNPKVAMLSPEARRALEHTRRSQASRKAAATVRAERAKRSAAAKKAARARAKKAPARKPAPGRAARVRRLQTQADLPPGDVVREEIAAAGSE